MRIRKIKHTKNEYIFAGGVWVRNFGKWGAKPVNESCMIPKEDHYTIIHNEYSNRTFQLGNIAEEKFAFPNVVIVSDGYNFEERVKVLHHLPDRLCVIAVNGALKKWPLLDNSKRRVVNFYVVNNPYDECMFFMPRRYFPACIASTRTNPEFVGQYPGVKYLYEPTPEKVFGVEKHEKYFIDDYRNPVCAAMGLAYQFGAEKIMTLCCDDSFVEEKSAAVRLDNGLWAYPHQVRSQEIIDANAFWLKKLGVNVADYSSGVKSSNAEYITCDDDAQRFFERVKQ